MLVLSRHTGERIKIGDNIWITIVNVDRGKVRIGVDAPIDIHIAREELLPIDQRHDSAPVNKEPV